MCTLFCFGFFLFDITLLHLIEPTYKLSCRFTLDMIATVVLVFGIQQTFELLFPVLGYTNTLNLLQGTAARASRAARVGSRAGRMMKHMTRLSTAALTFVAARSKKLRQRLKKLAKQRKATKKAKKDAKQARAERASAWADLARSNSHAHMALSMAVDSHRRHEDNLAEKSAGASTHSRMSRYMHGPRKDKRLASAEEDKKRAEEARARAEKHANKQTQGAPSRVGVYVLELFVSKITLMMLAILMLNAFLSASNEEAQNQEFREQTILATKFRGEALLPADDAAFLRNAPFACPRQGTGDFDCDDFKQRHRNATGMRLFFVRANGTVLYRDPDVMQLFCCRRFEELTYLRDEENCDVNLLHPLLEEGLHPLNDTLLGGGCPTIVVYDNERSARKEIENQLVLTGFLVLILVVGMAFLGADMQAHLISPIERLTKVVKVLSGKTWRKRAKERHHSEDSHDEKKNVPALKRAADFMNDLRLDVYTITRMVGLVMDDMQKLYGFHMAKQRQRLHAFETGFDKLFVVFHSALGAG